MKFQRNFFTSLIVAFALSLTAAVHAQTVVTWNLEWFPGRVMNNPKPAVAKKQMEACQAALKKLSPDIFIAEEARDLKAFEELCSVVPDLKVCVVSRFTDADGSLTKQQVAIASKYKAVAAWSEPWKHTTIGVPRGYAFAALEDPSGKGLLMVYGLHLKSNRGNDDEEAVKNGEMRDESVKQLLAHMASMGKSFKDKPVKGWVVAGDINTNEDGKFKDSVVKTMEAAGFWNSWKDVPVKDRLTWRGNRFSKFEPVTFDYIFTKNLGEHKASLSPESEEASDHWPVVLKLKP